MDSPCAIEGDCVEQSPAHEIDQKGIEPDFNRMGSHHQNNRAPVSDRSRPRGDDLQKIFRGQKPGQAGKESPE
jgi:hypothetical protein